MRCKPSHCYCLLMQVSCSYICMLTNYISFLPISSQSVCCEVLINIYHMIILSSQDKNKPKHTSRYIVYVYTLIPSSYTHTPSTLHSLLLLHALVDDLDDV